MLNKWTNMPVSHTYLKYSRNHDTSGLPAYCSGGFILLLCWLGCSFGSACRLLLGLFLMVRIGNQQSSCKDFQWESRGWSRHSKRVEQTESRTVTQLGYRIQAPLCFAMRAEQFGFEISWKLTMKHIHQKKFNHIFNWPVESTVNSTNHLCQNCTMI